MCVAWNRILFHLILHCLLFFCTTYTSVPAFIDEIIYAANIFTNTFAIRNSLFSMSDAFLNRWTRWKKHNNEFVQTRTKTSDQRCVCNYKWIAKMALLLPFSGYSYVFFFLLILVCASWSSHSFFFSRCFVSPYMYCFSRLNAFFKHSVEILHMFLSLPFNRLFP